MSLSKSTSDLALGKAVPSVHPEEIRRVVEVLNSINEYDGSADHVLSVLYPFVSDSEKRSFCKRMLIWQFTANGEDIISNVKMFYPAYLYLEWYSMTIKVPSIPVDSHASPIPLNKASFCQIIDPYIIAYLENSSPLGVRELPPNDAIWDEVPLDTAALDRLKHNVRQMFQLRGYDAPVFYDREADPWSVTFDELIAQKVVSVAASGGVLRMRRFNTTGGISFTTEIRLSPEANLLLKRVEFDNEYLVNIPSDYHFNFDETTGDAIRPLLIPAESVYKCSDLSVQICDDLNDPEQFNAVLEFVTSLDYIRSLLFGRPGRYRAPNDTAEYEAVIRWITDIRSISRPLFAEALDLATASKARSLAVESAGEPPAKRVKTC